MVYMRSALILFILTAGLTLGLFSAPVFAETMTVGRIEADNSRNMVLKKIVEKIGNRMLALVVDREGREQHIYITGEDALEIKRGLWVIRPGTYQIDI
jgi:hypothetical protein